MHGSYPRLAPASQILSLPSEVLCTVFAQLIPATQFDGWWTDLVGRIRVRALVYPRAVNITLRNAWDAFYGSATIQPHHAWTDAVRRGPFAALLPHLAQLGITTSQLIRPFPLKAHVLPFISYHLVIQSEVVNEDTGATDTCTYLREVHPELVNESGDGDDDGNGEDDPNDVHIARIIHDLPTPHTVSGASVISLYAKKGHIIVKLDELAEAGDRADSEAGNDIYYRPGDDGGDTVDILRFRYKTDYTTTMLTFMYGSPTEDVISVPVEFDVDDDTSYNKLRLIYIRMYLTRRLFASHCHKQALDARVWSQL